MRARRRDMRVGFSSYSDYCQVLEERMFQNNALGMKLVETPHLRVNARLETLHRRRLELGSHFVGDPLSREARDVIDTSTFRLFRAVLRRGW